MGRRSTWTRHGMAFAALVLAGGTTLVALPARVGAETADAADAAAVVTTTFEYTGAEQTYTVPESVCGITVDAYGAQGGTGTGAVAAEVFVDGFLAQIPGGLGGRATSRVAVTPGEVLAVNVGGRGGDGTASATATANSTDPASAEADAGGGDPGFNGGGEGAWGTITIVSAPDAGNKVAIAAASASGGGGGASDVRQGGTDLTQRVIVAGGGGGGAGYGVFALGSQVAPTDVTPQYVATDFFTGGAGGDGGGATGGPGAEGENSPGGTGGGGGTPTAGGAAGVGVDPFPATAGALGLGGDAGGQGLIQGDFDPSVSAFIGAGGGGGGGYYGGGGGTLPGLTDVEVPPDPETGPGGGGGGSGHAPLGALTSAVHAGNGLVVISYDPVADACPPAVLPTFTG